MTNTGHPNLIGLQRSIAWQLASRGVAQLYHEAAQAPTEWEQGHLREDADKAFDILLDRKREWENDGQGSM